MDKPKRRKYRPPVSRRIAQKLKGITVRSRCQVLVPGVTVLEKKGQGRLYDLLCWSEEELKAEPGIGPGSVREFRRIVREDLRLTFKPGLKGLLFDPHDGDFPGIEVR